MAYASRSGRARVSAKNPQAFGVCDRCGFWNNLVNLNWQHEWRGTTIQNIWIRVCRRCLDVPQEQLRAIQLPADPVTVWQPRVENFADAETDYRSTVPGTIDAITGLPVPSTTLRVTQDCRNRSMQPIGAPDGLDQNAVMPYNGGVQKAFGTPLAILSAVSNGTATIAVTCSQAHGMQTNSQIAVSGLTAANGFYSVTVVSATAFTYTTPGNIAAASLLTYKTRIVTALVGLPYGTPTVPAA